MTTGEGERLRLTLDFVLPELIGATRKFLDHPRISDLYPEYLYSCFLTARSAVALMEAARDRSAAMADGDRVCAALSPYLDSHILEEVGHDEWFLEDLAHLGRDRDQILSLPPSATEASLLGAQYYWILHYHPVAIVGFLAALEGNPPTRPLIDELMAKTGYGAEAFRTLIEHAELDPHHGRELFELLDGLPLSAQQSQVVVFSGLHSLHLAATSLTDMMDDLAP